MKYLLVSLLVVVLVTSFVGSVNADLNGREIIIRNSQLSPIVVSSVESDNLLIPVDTLVLPGESLKLSLPAEPSECWVGWKSLRGQYKLRVV